MRQALPLLLASAPCASAGFFDSLPGSRKLDQALDLVLRLYPESGEVLGLSAGDFKGSFSSHCLRVGMCTALLKVGLNETAIKAWAGWSVKSNIWDKYSRHPVFYPEEVDFVKSLFLQVLPA